MNRKSPEWRLVWFQAEVFRCFLLHGVHDIGDGFQHEGWKGRNLISMPILDSGIQGLHLVLQGLFPVVINVKNGFQMKDCKVDVDLNEHFGEFIMQTQRILQ